MAERGCCLALGCFGCRATPMCAPPHRDKWSDYFENCLYLDVQINRKFTWDALFGAEDVFAFLDTVRQSPLRGLYLNDVFHTCDKAYPLIKKAFADAAGDDINLLAQHLWGKNAQQYKAQTEQSLQRSYAKFVKFSTARPTSSSKIWS